MATPDFNAQLGYGWGFSVDDCAFIPTISTASNIIVGTNPAYGVNDLTAIYPQFAATFIPAAVMNAYIALASGSIFQDRWGEMWNLAMANFIAHYLTLWAQGQASPNSTAAQLASSGLALGIKTSKSAGDVSVGVTPVVIDGYGAWNLTFFGQQLATWASVVGSGSALIW